MEIHVLRLGHRLPRDERISTHVALVARAFGAQAVVYTGQHDSGLERSVERICQRWGGAAGGGPFTISYEKSHRPLLKRYRKQGFAIAHLTMYGIPLEERLGALREHDKLLMVVGSEQVPGDVYELSDFNISVTDQPHSEVAALAIAMDRLMGGRELGGLDFHGKIRINPSERGKSVEEIR